MAPRRLRALAGAAALALSLTAGAAAALSLREFVAYFDLNRSELTPEAGRLVREFAHLQSVQPVARIVVVGHADRSGEEIYNGGLSLRRADAVARELARLGVDPAIISVEGRGEAQPALPTPDGQPEQLNRRVEIVYLK